MWNIISWIIVGGVAGWLASIVMSKNAEMGILANIIVGILGAIIGGFIMGLFSPGGVGSVLGNAWSLWNFIVAVVGAIILLWVVGLFRRTA